MMPAQRRLPVPRKLLLGDIARLIGGRVVGDSGVRISGFSTLDSAGPGDICFYNNTGYREQLRRTRAAAVVLTAERLDDTELDRVVVSGDPRMSTMGLLDIFYPPQDAPVAGCHPTAVISGEAEVSPGACVGALATVGRGAEVARGARVGEGCRIGEAARIGEGAVIHANAVVCDRCIVGARSVIHAGAVIGADGFGFVRDGGVPKKLPQVGRVVVGEDVEVGALSAIDRGALGDTVVGDRVKIDNHVQIGHNVRIGEDTVICGKSGISGSVTIGRRVTIGGNCGINGHIRIADDVVVTGGSSVVGSIEERGKQYAGVMPAMPAQEWWRRVSGFAQRKKPGRARAHGVGDGG